MSPIREDRSIFPQILNNTTHFLSAVKHLIASPPLLRFATHPLSLSHTHTHRFALVHPFTLLNTHTRTHTDRHRNTPVQCGSVYTLSTDESPVRSPDSPAFTHPDTHTHTHTHTHTLTHTHT